MCFGWQLNPFDRAIKIYRNMQRYQFIMLNFHGLNFQSLILFGSEDILSCSVILMDQQMSVPNSTPFAAAFIDRSVVTLCSERTDRAQAP
jgi:hypothetical protein